MKLNKSLGLAKLAYFFPSPTKEYATDRLKQLCIKYDTDLHLINHTFDDRTIEEIDSIYTLILTF